MNQASNLTGLLLNRNFYETTPQAHFREYKNDLSLVQRLTLERNLEVHTGCVNTIDWSTRGDYILSGSDDHYLCVTNAFDYKVKHKVKTSHASNIFSAKFLPQTGDRQVISCSANGRIIHTDLLRPEETAANIFNCIQDSVYDVVTVPNDPNSFLICSHDKTVRWYDLRVKHKCPHAEPFDRYSPCTEDILLNMDCSVTALAVNPRSSWQFAIGKSDSIISVFDRRKLGTQSLGANQSDPVNSLVSQFVYFDVKNRNRITSLSYNSCGNQLLASYSWGNIYLFDLNEIRSEQEQLKTAMEHEETTDDDNDNQSRRGCKRHFNIADYDNAPLRSSSPQSNRVSFPFGIRDLRYFEVDSYTLPERSTEQRFNSILPAYQILDSDGETQFHRTRFFLQTSSRSNNNDNDNNDDNDDDDEEDFNNDDDDDDDANNEDEEMPSVQSPNPFDSLIIPSPPSLVTPTSPNDDEPRRLSRSLRRNREFSFKLQQNKTKSRLTHFTKNFTKFTGHRNQKTLIKEANFWGDKFIVSGSDCGHVFFWSIDDQKPVALLKADRSVVNCVQPHPTAPILASSGIDNDIKIFSPVASENQFSKKLVDSVMASNKKTSSFDGPLHSRIVLHFYAALNRERNNDRQMRVRDPISMRNEIGQIVRNDIGQMVRNDIGQLQEHIDDDPFDSVF